MTTDIHTPRFFQSTQVASALSRAWARRTSAGPRRRGAQAGAGPDRKRYEITAAGRDAVEEWIRSPQVPADSIRADLFAKTIIALLLGEDAERLLDLQRAAHTARMREITRRKDGADLHDVLIADHALFHIEADLRWIDLTAARLTELREQVRS